MRHVRHTDPWLPQDLAALKTGTPDQALSLLFVFIALESCLEQLEIRFPREPLHTMFLLPVLKASKSLQQLSLDSATLPSSQELGLLLQALKGTLLSRR